MRYYIEFSQDFFGNELRIKENCHGSKGGATCGLFCHTKPIEIINRVGIHMLSYSRCMKSRILPKDRKTFITFRNTEHWTRWIWPIK